MTIRKYVNSNDPSPFMGEIKKMSLHAANMGLSISKQKIKTKDGEVQLQRINNVDYVTILPAGEIVYLEIMSSPAVNFSRFGVCETPTSNQLSMGVGKVGTSFSFLDGNYLAGNFGWKGLSWWRNSWITYHGGYSTQTSDLSIAPHYMNYSKIYQKGKEIATLPMVDAAGLGNVQLHVCGASLATINDKKYLLVLAETALQDRLYLYRKLYASTDELEFCDFIASTPEEGRGYCVSYQADSAGLNFIGTYINRSSERYETYLVTISPEFTVSVNIESIFTQNTSIDEVFLYDGPYSGSYIHSTHWDIEGIWGSTYVGKERKDILYKLNQLFNQQITLSRDIVTGTDITTSTAEESSVATLTIPESVVLTQEQNGNASQSGYGTITHYAKQFLIFVDMESNITAYMDCPNSETARLRIFSGANEVYTGEIKDFIIGTLTGPYATPPSFVFADRHYHRLRWPTEYRSLWNASFPQPKWNTVQNGYSGYGLHYPAGIWFSTEDGNIVVTESRWVENGQIPENVCPHINIGGNGVAIAEGDLVRWLAYPASFNMSNTNWHYIGNLSPEQKILSARSVGQLHHAIIPLESSGSGYFLTSDLGDFDSAGTDFSDTAEISNAGRLVSSGGGAYIDGWERRVSVSQEVSPVVPDFIGRMLRYGYSVPAQLVKIKSNVYGFIEWNIGSETSVTQETVVIGRIMEKLKEQLTRILNIKIIDMPSTSLVLPATYYCVEGLGGS